MSVYKAVRFVLLLLIFLLLPVRYGEAGKVVIISLNRTALRHVAADPSLSPWLVRGTVALLNVTTAARPTSEHIYVTLGAGSRAVGVENTRLAFHVLEEYMGFKAGDIFFRHQGREAQGEVLHLALAEISSANEALQHPVVPGLLGTTLRENGKVTAVLGNADAPGIAREAVVFLADGRGEVGLGDVSRILLRHDRRYPYGLRIDRENMWETVQSVMPLADVVLIDWGDTARLDEYRPLLRDSVAATLQAEIFVDVGWFIGQLMKQLTPDDLVVLLSPAPPVRESGGGLLSYCVVMGVRFPGGLLSSGTTRRTGIIAGIDLAPLILSHLGVEVPGAMLGSPAYPAGTGSVRDLLRQQAQIDRIFRLRPPLLKTYVFFQIVFVLGALFNVLAGLWRTKYFEAPLFGLLLFPVVLLYLPLQHFSVAAAFILAAGVTALAVFLLMKLWPGTVGQLAAVGVFTALSLMLDLLRQAPLMKMSVLGYDTVSGARYYGLGNEYMGVLVGTAVLGVVALLSLFPGHRKKLLPFAGLFFALLVLLIVSPGGGANFGGTVTALVAFLVTLAVLAQIRPGWRNGLVIVGILSLIFVLAFYLNLRVPAGEQSHLGRTLALLEQDGMQVLSDVASRKAAMNIKLFRYSQWSRAFVAFLAVLAVLFFRPRGILREIHRSNPDLTAGFLGIIAGSITAFMFNDSGVVAAATTLLYAGVPIILLSGPLNEKTGEKSAHLK